MKDGRRSSVGNSIVELTAAPVVGFLVVELTSDKAVVVR